MKLLCDIAVGNRLAPNVKRKHAKSTMALCKHSKSNDFCIILFAGQNKNGTKYNIKNNINQIFAKCVNEGKATIQFKEPPQDLYIQAEPIQLRGFLHLLKRVLEEKVSDKELSFSSMAVTPISKKNIPPTRLFIKNRSEYPIQGFPKSIEILHITDIQKCSLDRSILSLTKLRILNLSNNCIEYLPQELSELPCLADINVANNHLGKCTPKQWTWIRGNLLKTLKSLNLSNNGLKYLPDQLVKFDKLVYLLINNNELQVLPPGIGNLKHLQVLRASNNMLSSLPGSVRSWRLLSLDISNNAFNHNQQNQRRPQKLPKPLPVSSLKDAAAQKLLLMKIPYDKKTLPSTVVSYLDCAKYCICGKACFNNFIRHSQTLLLSSIARNLNLSPGLEFVPLDSYFCSLKCFVSVCTRIRHSII